MATTTIGSLIVELRANSASFRAEMDAARKKTREAGQSANDASRQIAKLAADGFGAVLPISFQVENALERFIEKAGKAQGALALFAKATLLLGAGLAAFKIGERIGEFAALGTTADKYAENIRKATEEQKKFSSTMESQRGVMRNLAKELATLRGDQAGVLDATTRAAEDQIIKQFGGASPKARAALALLAQVRVEQEKKALDEQRKLRDAEDQKLLDQITKQRDEQVKAWKDETTALVDQLKTRLKLRQDFEAAFGQGGLPGQGTAGGLAASRALREQLQKESRDLAFAEREGIISPRDATFERENIRSRALEEAQRLRQEFQAFPVVLEAIDKAVASVEFGNFGREMAAARAHLAAFVPTSQELETALGGIAGKLVETVPATEAAAEATRQLTQDYLGLANAIYQVNVQQAALVAAEAAANAAAPAAQEVTQ